jgi:hypothetical protein
LSVPTYTGIAVADAGPARATEPPMATAASREMVRRFTDDSSR